MFRRIGYWITGVLVFVCDLLFSVLNASPSQSYPCLLSLRKIWDQAPHNAFTDLIYYRKNFICVFRESDSHASGTDGLIRILSSKDGKEWSSVAVLKLDGIDLRDPHLSVMPDGRLHLIMGGSKYAQEKLLSHNSYATFSNDGSTWTTIQSINLKNEWLWRVAWHGSNGYSMAYSLTDLNDVDKPWFLKLFKTTDGLHFEFVCQMDIPQDPAEAALQFLSDETMVALIRRDGVGLIAHAPPPYTQWKWKEIDYRLGGPNFLVFPGGQMWAASRLIDGENRRTILASMNLEKYEPLLQFPSGGDTGYPGMVYLEGKLYVSYYSSHEGKAAIYLAELAFLPFKLF